MRNKTRILPFALPLLGVIGAIFLAMTLGSQAAPLPAKTTTQLLPYRETSGNGRAPDISFIDSPSPTCYRPATGTGTCYIQWEYMNVTASAGAYVISMTVSIDNQIRAYHAGFFQTSMYIPGTMTGMGYKVTCGAPGEGSLVFWGNTYPYTIRARETTGLTAANYGSVTCPADLAQIFLPFIHR